jgi:hypothetical protein
MVYRASRRRTAVATSVACIAAGAVFARILAIDETLGFALAVGAIGLVALRLPTVAWVGFAVTSPWVSRLLTEHHLAPRFFDFLDFPLCAAAFTTALLAYSNRRSPLGSARKRVVVCAALFGGVIAASWLVNPTEPQRLAAGLVFVLQPFLLIVAMILDPPNGLQRRRLEMLLVGIIVLQYPVALAQSAIETDPDEIKGTLLGAGAGHHVMAGTLMIGLLVFTRLGWPKLILVGCAVITVAIAVSADAKQVLFVAPLGFLATALVPNNNVAAPAGRRAMTFLLAGIAIVGLLSYSATQTAFDFIDRTRESDGGKVAVAQAITRDTLGDPAHVALGYGPGQTVSRFAFLNTDLLARKSGNPMELLGLSTAKRAAMYDEIASAGPFIGRTSFTSPQSSVLGILGDYGLLGLTTYGALLIAVLRALRSSSSRIAAGVIGGWAMAVPLGLVFDWLEQPPFMLFLALATGLAVTEPMRGRRGARAPDGAVALPNGGRPVGSAVPAH